MSSNMNAKSIIIPIALLFVSCEKYSGRQESEDGFEPHPTWTQGDSSAFWEKQPNGSFRIDTVWDSDTTINL